MKPVLLLLPLVLYLLCRPFSRTLQSLPNSNDDFILF